MSTEKKQCKDCKGIQIHNENTVTDLLKAFLGNGSINTVYAQHWKMCLGGRRVMRIAMQQRTNEDASKESHDLFSV
jgi:hypothetical protein